jgi:hypothetical protein
VPIERPARAQRRENAGLIVSPFNSEFRSFGIAAARFFPGLLSDEVLFDQLARRTHFDWSWQAVRYRYRSCPESSEEFEALFDNPSQGWQSGWGDEELTYKFELCI